MIDRPRLRPLLFLVSACLLWLQLIIVVVTVVTLGHELLLVTTLTSCLQSRTICCCYCRLLATIDYSCHCTVLATVCRRPYLTFTNTTDLYALAYLLHILAAGTVRAFGNNFVVDWECLLLTHSAKLLHPTCLPIILALTLIFRKPDTIVMYLRARLFNVAHHVALFSIATHMLAEDEISVGLCVMWW